MYVCAYLGDAVERARLPEAALLARRTPPAAAARTRRRRRAPVAAGARTLAAWCSCNRVQQLNNQPQHRVLPVLTLSKDTRR